MATTRWLNNVTGNDAFTGANPTDSPPGTGPKLTWDAAIQQVTSTGDVMNVMNTGTTYDISVTRNIGNAAALAGTDFGANFGCKIQGVTNDATQNPSVVKLRHTAAGVSMIGVREAQNFVIIQGFYVDRPNTTVGGTQNTLTFVNINDGGGGDAGALLVRYCVDESNATKTGAFVREVAGSGNLSQTRVEYCLIKNWGTNGGVVFSTSLNRQILVNNIVFYRDLAGAPVSHAINFGVVDSGANTDHRARYCTFVGAGTSRLRCINSAAPTANAAAQKHVNSNVFVQFTTGAATDFFLDGNAVWEDLPWTGTRTIGFNVFVDAGGFSWDANHPYEVPWDKDNIDAPPDTGQLWSTDTSDTAGGADPFNASGTPFNWNANQSGYIIPLPGDYRLQQHRTAGAGGTVPGALIEGVTPPVAVDDFYSINYTTTLNQSAPGVLANDSDADPGDVLTATLVTGISPAAAGALVLNSDGSFLFTPTSGFVGIATFTYKAFDGFFFSNVATATITITRPPETILGSSSLLGPGIPGKVFPALSLRLLMNSHKRLELETPDGAVTQVMAAHAASASVAPGAVDAALSMGSIATAKSFMLKTDAAITVRINAGPAVPVGADGCTQVVETAITSITVSNAATNRTASISYLVTA